MITETICRNIRHICKERGLKIGEIEEAAEVSKGYLARCGTGRHMMTIDRAKVFAELLDVDIEELMSEYKSGWKSKEPWRNKCEIWICPHCGEICYCRLRMCNYKFCPHCGEVVLNG